ncbi:MAG: YciI family protein [Caulobacter sp.]|nr:YciI family protein [Caulobacter sp.]
MPLFIIQWKDRVPEGAAIRAATRQAHLDWGGSQPGVLKLGGPFLDADGGMAGSLIIIEAESLEAARAWHAADPYSKAGLYETSSVEPWRVTMPWKD